MGRRGGRREREKRTGSHGDEEFGFSTVVGSTKRPSILSCELIGVAGSGWKESERESESQRGNRIASRRDEEQKRLTRVSHVTEFENNQVNQVSKTLDVKKDRTPK